MRKTSEVSWKEHRESTSLTGMKLLMLLYRTGGTKAVLLLAWIASWIVWACNSRVRSLSRNYLNLLKSSAENKGVALPELSTRRHIYSFCRAVAMKPLSWSGRDGLQKLMSIDGGLEKLLELSLSPDPAMVISAHIGNIEVIRAFNVQNVHKQVNVLMHINNSAVFMNYLKELNKDAFMNIIPLNDVGPELSIQLSDCIQKGEWLAMMGDRLLNGESRFVEVDFLGKKARFPAGPWVLAAILKIPVYLVFGLTGKQGTSVYLKSFGQVVLPRKDRDEAIRKYAGLYAAELEKILYKYPYEWFNFYDFWSLK